MIEIIGIILTITGVIVAVVFHMRQGKKIKAKEIHVIESLRIPTKEPENLKAGNIWVG